MWLYTCLSFILHCLHNYFNNSIIWILCIHDVIYLLFLEIIYGLRVNIYINNCVNCCQFC